MDRQWMPLDFMQSPLIVMVWILASSTPMEQQTILGFLLYHSSRTTLLWFAQTSRWRPMELFTVELLYPPVPRHPPVPLVLNGLRLLPPLDLLAGPDHHRLVLLTTLAERIPFRPLPSCLWFWELSFSWWLVKRLVEGFDVDGYTDNF